MTDAEQAEKIGALTANMKTVCAELKTIKETLEILVNQSATEKGFRLMGRAFAVGMGVSTPIAVAWAMLG